LALYIPTNEFVALKYTDLTISIDYALIKELKVIIEIKIIIEINK